MVEYWQSIQRGIWTLDSARQLQQAGERLLRHAQRFEQQEHIDIAQSLELCMEQVLATQGRLTSETIDMLDQLMQRLAAARLQNADEHAGEGGAASRARSKPLYLAIADLERSRYLASQLAFYGMQVEVLEDAACLREAFRERYPLALVLHRKDGVTPGTVAKLHSWLHNVQGHALPFAQTAKLYPEFTPEKVAEEFLKWL